MSLDQGSLDHERDVLADYGNMSAPTALFVLERLVRAGLPSRTLLTAMGPGFTASCVSLKRPRDAGRPAAWLRHRGAAGANSGWPGATPRRCSRRARIEVAPGHYPADRGAACALARGLWVLGAAQPIDPAWLAVFLSLQVLRVWVLATLGARWTTRIIVLPGAPLVASGPYRFVSHPNYLVVIGEIAVLPLCLGLPWFALVFSWPTRSCCDPHPRRERGARPDRAMSNAPERDTPVAA